MTQIISDTYERGDSHAGIFDWIEWCWLVINLLLVDEALRGQVNDSCLLSRQEK